MSIWNARSLRRRCWIGEGVVVVVGLSFSLVETWRLRAMLVWERLVVL